MPSKESESGWPEVFIQVSLQKPYPHGQPVPHPARRCACHYPSSVSHPTLYPFASVMFLPLSLLAVLPLTTVWAAPMCSLKPHKSAAATSSASAPSGSPVGATGTSGSSRNSSSVGDEVVATTWYAGWHGTDFPPENLSWSKYSAATYAFASVYFRFLNLLSLT